MNLLSFGRPGNFQYFSSTRKSVVSTATRFYSSQVSVTNGPALLNKTYQQLISEQIKLYPHKDVLRSVAEDYKFTFADIQKHSDSVAAGILNSSTKKYPYAIALPLRMEAFMGQIGAARATVPFAVIPPGCSNEVLESQLKVINPSVLVWPAKVFKTVQLNQVYEVFPEITKFQNSPYYDVRFPNLKYVLQLSRQDLNGLIAYGDMLLPQVKTAINNVEKDNHPNTPNTFLVNQDNKITTFSQSNLINTGYLTGHRAGLNESDIVYTNLLLSNSSGLSLGMGLTLSHKVKLVYGSDVFDEEITLKNLAATYSTVLLIQPNELERLLTIITPQNAPKTLTKLIVVSSPGNLASQQLLTEAQEKLHVKIIVTFGTNETTGVISSTEFDSPLSTNLVGKPLPHTEIQIVDSNGKQVPAGTSGKLIVKGFTATNGFDDPEYTKKRIVNGYLHTSIEAKLDQNKNILIL